MSVGALVTLFGLPAGEVSAVGLGIDPATLRIRGRVDLVSFPERLVASLRAKQTEVGQALIRSAQQRQALMQRLVEQRGLRAQLRSGNLLTGQLFVAFDFYANAPKVKIDWRPEVLEVPVVTSTVSDLETKITGIVAKLDKLPLEAIGADVTKALASLNQTLEGASKAVNRIDTDVAPGLKSTLDGLRGTIAAEKGYDALAAAHSRALARLSQDIATAVRALESAGK